MYRLIVLFFLLSPFMLQAQQPAAFPVAFTVSGDTLTLDTMRFIRFKPRSQKNMRMNICDSVFCITDQSGAVKPYRVSRLLLQVNINGVFVDKVAPAPQADQQFMSLLYGMKRGAECYFEAYQVTDGAGKPVNTLLHEPMCFRKLN